jgi:hypothetical protein
VDALGSLFFASEFISSTLPSPISAYNGAHNIASPSMSSSSSSNVAVTSTTVAEQDVAATQEMKTQLKSSLFDQEAVLSPTAEKSKSFM